MSELTIALDIDGVLADSIMIWLHKYNQDYGDHLIDADITDWDLVKFVKPECGAKIYDYLVPELYDTVNPTAGAKDYVTFARLNGNRVIFVTSVANEYGAKYKWLIRNGFFEGIAKPKMDYIETSDKSLIRADMLVDDGIHNLLTFTGYKVLFDQPWNLGKIEATGLERVRDFAELSYFTMSSIWRPQ